MNLPNLREIFYKHDLVEEVTPELRELNREFQTALNKAVDDNFKKFDEVDCKASSAGTEMQYIGFVQGFTFARSLFIGELFTPYDSKEGRS